MAEKEIILLDAEEKLDFQTQVENDLAMLNSSVETVNSKLRSKLQSVMDNQRTVERHQQNWREEKEKIDATVKFASNRVVLDVGGVKFTTSLSTLNKRPDSMLGIMFSGRHDLKAIQAADGSFFIDRDGTLFGYILNYLRDGIDELVLPQSTTELLQLKLEANYYQLTELVDSIEVVLGCSVTQRMIQKFMLPSTGAFQLDYVLNQSDALMLQSQKFNAPPHRNRGVSRNPIIMNQASFTQPIPVCGSLNQPLNFHMQGGNNTENFITEYKTKEKLEFKNKCLQDLKFQGVYFSHPVVFLQCDLTGCSFRYCHFNDHVSFDKSILDGVTFSFVGGLVKNKSTVSFAKAKVDETNFDSSLRSLLKL